MNTKLVLSVQQLGKQYGHFDRPQDRLRALFGWGGPPPGRHSLRNVTFELMAGQCLGVVGDNGAGKSTLLKLLAGTLVPSEGGVQCDGRVTAILELGAGFHPEFTGRENLGFAGRLSGLSDVEVAELAPEIMAFAGLGEAIDRPVKTYSSGMLVRLAFAVVTAKQPEVLIIDEALAVGDQAFQKKCVDRIAAFRRSGCTILFCSHSLYHVRNLCDQALWLHQGQVQRLGDTDSVLAAYDSHVRRSLLGEAVAADGEGTEKIGIGIGVSAAASATQSQVTRPGRVEAPSRLAPEQAGLLWMEIECEPDLNGGPVRLRGADLVVRLAAQLPAGEMPSLGIMLEQAHGVGITSTTTHIDGVQPRQTSDGIWEVELRFPELSLHSGEYVLSAYLFDEQGLVVYEEWKSALYFAHVYPDGSPGLVRLPHQWR